MAEKKGIPAVAVIGGAAVVASVLLYFATRAKAKVCTPGETKCEGFDLYECQLIGPLGGEASPMWVPVEANSPACGWEPGEAEFQVSDLAIEPPQVYVGEPVTISCMVTNVGGKKGTKTVTLGGDFMAQKTVTLNPGESQVVSFEATPQEARTYQVSVDGLTVSFTAVAPLGIQITNVTLSPTRLTSARHEYETSLGLGYWGDPFTISITFSNPFDYDVWVKPDYAFGHLNGGALGFVNGDLQGFSAEKLLYFRLLLQSAYIEGDYSYDTDWQKPWDAKGQNVSSGLAFVYDPDGVPRMGDERWLKVPAGGSVTTTKEAHLGAKLSTKGWKCTTCGEVFTGSVKTHYEEKHPHIEVNCWSWGGYSGCTIVSSGESAADQVDLPAEGVAGFHDLCVAALRAIYFVYDPGCGQTRVGGKIVTLNWRLEELNPVAVAVPDMVEIVSA